MTAYVVNSPLISARYYVGEASLTSAQNKERQGFGDGFSPARLHTNLRLDPETIVPPPPTVTTVFLQPTYLEALTGVRYSSRRLLRTA